MSRSNLWRRLRLIVLVVLAGGAVFVLVFWISTWATSRPRSTQPAVTLSLGGLDEQGIPIYSYAAVDPAMIPALEAASHPTPLAVKVDNIPPIGVYLPSTGDTQFALPLPTPTRTLAPLKTSTPMPTTEDSTGLGIITPAPATLMSPFGSVGPAALEYAGDGCAPSGWPGAGTLTQYFHRWHSGMDIGIPLNSGVVATHSGEVIFAGWRTDGYGNLIIIQNGAFITYYAHLNSFNVSAGQKVGRGSVIGWSGSTGNSTGPHIHYEIRINDVPVDPLTFEKRGYESC